MVPDLDYTSESSGWLSKADWVPPPESDSKGLLVGFENLHV